MAENALWYGLGLLVIFIIVIAIFLINHFRQAKKKSKLDTPSAHISPSSFDSESKTKMMSRLGKRESLLRRERILEGGTLPEIYELVVYYPNKNDKISSPEVDVRGKTAIKSIVWINNHAAFVDVDGSFIGTIKLFRGKNIINIVAIGPYGKTMGINFDINCTAKTAINHSTSMEYQLNGQTFDLENEDSLSSPSTSVIQTHSIVSSRKKTVRDKPFDEKFTPKIQTSSSGGDPVIVSQSEIDPSVLAALKGDPLEEESFNIETAISLEDIAPEPVAEIHISEDDIPPIPEIPKLENEPSLPVLPKDIISEDEKSQSVQISEDEDFSDSIKLLEKVVVSQEERIDKFPLDDMLPKQPYEKSEESLLDQLEEFQPLLRVEKGMQELVVETKKQELHDERKTVILQHNGLIRKDNGELVQFLKVEKRLECVIEKWFSTIGIVNVSKEEIESLFISEFVSNTIEFTGKLPANVEEPKIERLQEGVRLTWKINNIKPQMRLFITFNEKINPLEKLKESQIQPIMIIRK